MGQALWQPPDTPPCYTQEDLLHVPNISCNFQVKNMYRFGVAGVKKAWKLQKLMVFGAGFSVYPEKCM